MSGRDEPAFPHSATPDTWDGLTKREIFAGMAMQGLLSNLEGIYRLGFKQTEIEAFAVMRADALIAELARGGES